jgi:hypothetical protein
MRFRRSDTLGLVVCTVTLGTLLTLITYSMQVRKASAIEDTKTQAALASDATIDAAVVIDPYNNPASAAAPSPFMLLVDLSIILLSWCFFFLVSWIFFYRKLFQDYETRMIHSVQVCVERRDNSAREVPCSESRLMLSRGGSSLLDFRVCS